MSELIEAVKANDVEKVRDILLLDKYLTEESLNVLNEIKFVFQMKDLDLDMKDQIIMCLRKIIKKDISLIPTIVDLIEPIILPKIGIIYDLDHFTIYEILELFWDIVIALYGDGLEDGNKDKNNPINIKLFKLLTPLTFRRDNNIDYLANSLRNKIRRMI